ncbi:MAG: PTS sugar transporter subunit IIB [Anaerolineaceae bacterium]|nr:PTS sugar transporter subunit IIB [Anaerolineaceae bacterium]
MIKIGCVCGMGLGSGLLVKMGVDKVLKRAGYKEGTWLCEVLDISTARQSGIDIYVTSKEFADSLMDTPAEVVTVFNLFKEQEIEEALIPVYKEVLKKKKE